MSKIIYLNGRFLTQTITGVQRTAYELVIALDELIELGIIDKNKYLLILIYSGTLTNPISLKHIKIIKKGVLKGNLWEQLELPFYTADGLLLSMCTVSTLFKIKQIVIIHDASPAVNPSYFPFAIRVWYKLAFKVLGTISRQIITVSNFSKSELVKCCGFNPHKVAVVYNAANHILKYKEPNEAFKQKIEALKPYCLAVSSLGANKNFKSLSRAVNSINFKNYKMLIAGGVMPTLQNAILDTSVNYLGYVSNEELKYLYAHASLFIFPSFYEGFGIPPLEAMISGCPVLASHTSALPEVLGDACKYCDPANYQSIASQITLLINNADGLVHLKAKGYQQAAKYNWHTSALQVFEIIKGFLD